MNYLLMLFLSIPHLGSTKVDTSSTDAAVIHETTVNENYNIMKRIEEYAPVQDSIYSEYCSSETQAAKSRNAYILSELWRYNHLKNELKTAITQRDYHVTLFQIFGVYKSPNFTVRNRFEFPFPPIWTKFTPRLFVNSDTMWAPERPQREHSMVITNSTITSRIGGYIYTDDTLYYEILLQHFDQNELVWETTLRTNSVVVQDVKLTQADKARIEKSKKPSFGPPSREKGKSMFRNPAKK